MTMHKTILTLVVAFFATTAVVAQEKTVPTMATTSSTNDALDQQKREISRDLKNTLGNTENMIRQLKEMSVTATGADQEAYKARVGALLESHKLLTEQLDVVNKANKENSKAVFTTAGDVLMTANKLLDAQKSELGAKDEKAPTTK